MTQRARPLGPGRTDLRRPGTSGIAKGQTFGVEFELTCEGYGEAEPDDEAWYRVAAALVDRLERGLGSARVQSNTVKAYGTPGYQKWKVEHDPSTGWEVVSPVLCGREGLLELVVACEVLTDVLNDDELGLTLNHRTGTHVHIGWLADDNAAARAIQLTHLFEPLLRTLVHPSRFALYDEHDDRYDTQRPNPYCRPVSSVYAIESLDESTMLGDLAEMAEMDMDGWPRAVTFNPSPLWDDRESHVEVRLLSGTAEAEETVGVGEPLDAYSVGRRGTGSGVRVTILRIRLTTSRTWTSRICWKSSVCRPSERRSSTGSGGGRKQSSTLWRRHEDLREWLPAERQPAYLRVTAGHRRDAEVQSDRVAAQQTVRRPRWRWQGLRDLVRSRWRRRGAVAMDATIRKCAERLRQAQWASFHRMGPRSRLYREDW